MNAINNEDVIKKIEILLPGHKIDIVKHKFLGLNQVTIDDDIVPMGGWGESTDSMLLAKYNICLENEILDYIITNYLDIFFNSKNLKS